MARLRLNNVGDPKGTANPITFADGSTTTGTWTSAPSFATIASPDYAVIVVEPDTANEEIVHLTAYTAGATTGTFTRAQEGSTGVAHAAKAWVHGPVANDFVPSVGDATKDGQVVTYDSTTASGLKPAASGSYARRTFARIEFR